MVKGMNILDKFEWLARYGFIDIIFGLGVISFLVRLIRKAFPTNYEHLHINVSMGGHVSIPPNIRVSQSFLIHLSNAGTTNLYIARAYFRAQQPNYFTEYEALIRPGHSNRQTTWLALEQPVNQQLIDRRGCGVLYIEYAASGRQGVHRTKV